MPIKANNIFVDYLSSTIEEQTYLFNQASKLLKESHDVLNQTPKSWQLTDEEINEAKWLVNNLGEPSHPLHILGDIISAKTSDPPRSCRSPTYGNKIGRVLV